MAKFLIVLGALLLGLGLLMAAGVSLPLGRLPGDIAIRRENVSFYFPLGTCVLLSLLFSLLAKLFH